MTDTDEHKVYQIRYQFTPEQLLDENTRLGKALIAKYGKPSSVEQLEASDTKYGGWMTLGAGPDEHEGRLRGRDRR